MIIDSDLIKKYNVACPRYTSYPTVPYWDKDTFSETHWKQNVQIMYSSHGAKEGINLYIHLPFCESLCTYCGCNTRITVNHAVEKPYLETVLKEWNLYRQLLQTDTIQIREIHLGGGTPTFFSPENLEFLIKGILKNASVLPGSSFSVEGHPANTSLAHLQTLYNLGFRRLSLGIQDFDPVVQDIINRKQTFLQVKEVTEAARRIGFTSVNYDLIYGLPKQTLTGLLDTIGKVLLLKPDRIAFYSYAHVPWIKPGQRKFTEEDLPHNEQKLLLYETGRALLEDAGYREIGMDHFALPSNSLYTAYKNRTLHRNFMGYTEDSATMLIGLGCSSISDTWTSFAQNIKSVEAYTEAVNSGKLPVFRGHVLTKEDLIIRQHILNLMCRMETSWEDPTLYCESMEEGVLRLVEMESDGLIHLENKKISITNTGRAFMRNCCYALDARASNQNPERQIFSNAI